MEEYQFRYLPRQATVGFTVWQGTTVAVNEGRLQGQEFDLAARPGCGFNRTVLLRNGAEVGYCRINHQAREASSTVADIWVHDDFRRGGLASVMTRIALRIEFELGPETSFAFRLNRRFRTPEAVPNYRGYTAASFARRIGFEPEFHLERLFRAEDIDSVDTIPALDGAPPAYPVRLKSTGDILAVYLTDPLTRRLLPASHGTHDFPIVPETLELMAQQDSLVVSNMNYLLRKKGIPELLNHLADHETEARDFAGHIAPLD
jgi:hypothetical protein